VTLTYDSVYFFTQWRKTIIETEKLKKENILGQLQSLKNQVNPHFLFNSLNTLVSIIPEDPDLAVEFTKKLSKSYRYILEIKDKEVITVREELEFLKAFEFLLKIRFGDNIHFDVQVAEEYQEMEIVPLALQLLIENAIKHNVVSSEKPLNISIYVERDKLVVKNNLQKIKQVLPSTKTGLENIKNRYKFLANKTVDVIVTHTEFIVTLPLLQLK
jgi:LytS/YehU family sensor histidine kinase